MGKYGKFLTSGIRHNVKKHKFHKHAKERLKRHRIKKRAKKKVKK